MIAVLGQISTEHGKVPGLVVATDWGWYHEGDPDYVIVADPIGDGMFRLDGITYPSEQAVRDALLLMAVNEYKCESIRIK